MPRIIPARLCPRCRAHALKHINLHHDALPIERCTRCRRIWLDGGELNAIINVHRALKHRGKCNRDEPIPRFRGAVIRRISAAIETFDQ